MNIDWTKTTRTDHRHGIVLCVLVGGLGFAGTALGIESYGELVEIARAKGDEYAKLRDRLLTTNPAPWDVSAAAEHSWEAGLVAFILNARLEDPEGFAKWDAARMTETRALGVFRYTERSRLTVKGALALHLEKVWKTATFPAMKAHHYRVGAMSAGSTGPYTLWRTVWQEGSVEELRVIAIHAIAGHQSDTARELVEHVLRNPAASTDAKTAALRGLKGGGASYAQEVAREALLNPQADTEVVDLAAWVLEDQAGPESYEALLRVAGDTSRSPGARCAALRTLSRNPRPEHLPVMLAAIGATSPKELQLCAVQWVSKYPVDDTRAAWRALARRVEAAEAAKRAIFFLVREGSSEDLEFVERLTEDEALTQEFRHFVSNTLRSKRWDDERREKARQRKEATP